MKKTFLTITCMCVNVLLLTQIAEAHEAWLLTAEEVKTLSLQAIPSIFTNSFVLVFVLSLFSLGVFTFLMIEERLEGHETRYFQPLKDLVPSVGPLLLRIGLAVNIGFGALGVLPRHGTAPWKSPTLFVPDMQVSLLPGGLWDWLPYIALACSVLLLLGLFTRYVSIVVIGIAALCCVGFGSDFLLYYCLHFVALALLLILWGGGLASVDRMLKFDETFFTRLFNEKYVWWAVQFMTGLTFVILAIGVKFLQPTLIIAILNHGNLHILGIPQHISALIMMSVELCAGFLLMFGYLIRPIALFLIGAFTFFAITLGETPLFHANLYALMIVMLMRGGEKVEFSKLVKQKFMPFNKVGEIQ